MTMREIADQLKTDLDREAAMTWTLEERKFLENNYGHMTQREIGKILGKTESAVSRMSDILDLQKPKVKKEKPPVYKSLQ